MEKQSNLRKVQNEIIILKSMAQNKLRQRALSAILIKFTIRYDISITNLRVYLFCNTFLIN